MRRPTFLLSLLLALLPLPSVSSAASHAVSSAGSQAGAQAPLTVATPGGPVTVVADRLEREGADELIVATGNAELLHGETRVLADRLEFDPRTGAAVATGRAVYWDRADRLVGERIEYDVESRTGVVHQGGARLAPHYRLRGERLERRAPGQYGLARGVFTTCDDDEPAWSFRFRSAEADVEDSLIGRGASFWVLGVPLVPFVPFFAAPIRRERQTGFLFPRFGVSSTRGMFVEQPFFWAMSDSRDLTLTLDWYEKLGVGLHAEYRYVLTEWGRGRLDGFLIDEAFRASRPADVDELRGWWSARHEWAGSGLTFSASVQGVTDDRIWAEYADRLHDRAAQRAESTVFLARKWSDWNLVGTLHWYEDLTTRHPVELYRLPELSLSGTVRGRPRPTGLLPGFPAPDGPASDAWQAAVEPERGLLPEGFVYSLDASLTNYVRDIGSSGVRLDTLQRVAQPLPIGPYLTLTPFVAGRLTAYDVTVDGLRTRKDGITVEVTRDDPRVRSMGETGVELETRLTRVFDVKAGGVDALLHSIEPRLRWAVGDGSNLDRLPNWGGPDQLGRNHGLEYSLTNRVRARGEATADGRPPRWELARLTLAQGLDLREEAGDRPLGDVRADLDVAPAPRGVRGRFSAAHGVYGEGLRSASVDLLYADRPALHVAGGYSWSDSGTSFVRAAADTELHRRLVARTEAQWDVRTDSLVEGRVGLDWRFQCWALTTEYVARARTDGRAGTDSEIRVAVSLLGLGGPFGIWTLPVAGGGSGSAPR